MRKPVAVSTTTSVKSTTSRASSGAISKAKAEGAIASTSRDLPAPEGSPEQPRSSKSSKKTNSPPLERARVSARLQSFRRQQADRRPMTPSPTRLGATAAGFTKEEAAAAGPSTSEATASDGLPDGFDSSASKDVIRALERAGWVLHRVKGSHHHFKHPTRTGLVTVPHPKPHIHRKTLNFILKQAGFSDSAPIPPQ